MFNRSEAGPNDEKFIFRTERFYKIWFSDNFEVFLPIEDQLRIIRLRARHPKTTISLVYSSTCLAKDTIEALDLFCKQQRIQAVCFETIKDKLNEENDKELHAIVMTEIQKCLDNTGGNMAAASDCARIMKYLIENYGIYADFDVSIDFQAFNNFPMTLRAPVLLHLEIVPIDNNGGVMIDPNSDFLAFSSNMNEGDQVSLEASRIIKKIQDIIISNYKKPFTVSVLFSDKWLQVESTIPGLREATQAFEAHCLKIPAEATIFGLRAFLSKHHPHQFLQDTSVINISGPSIYYAIYQNLFPKDQTGTPIFFDKKDQKKWNSYLQQIELSGTAFYPQLDKAIPNKNSIYFQKTMLKPNVRLCDKSWTEEGAKVKRKIDQDIIRATRMAQRLWRSPALSLERAIKKTCIDVAILGPLKKKDYGRVLRIACHNLRHDLVCLLLQWKNTKNLNLDVNEISASKTLTALDYAMNAKGDESIKEKIVKALQDSGAKIYNDPANSVEQAVNRVC